MTGAEIAPRSCFALKSDVRYRLVDGEAVIVVQGRGEVLGLNDTGSRAFDLAAKGMPFADIVEQVHSEFDVDKKTLEQDLRDLLVQLSGDGLLTLSSELSSEPRP